MMEEPSPAGPSFLDETINIQARDSWATTYRPLLYKYHDVISKRKFDLGWTDVVEHKIDLTDDDPVPLEHRQTIYDWVKKVAIEVSRSTYNLPIFLMPKLYGQVMRAVLEYYTIREIWDCIDKIGLAESNLFTTINLSGFWQ